MREATEKMIAYAEAIANKLGVRIQNYSFVYVGDFIKENKDYYNQILKDEETKHLLNYTRNTFSDYKDLFNELVCENNISIGIYLLWSFEKIVYIGKSRDLKNRVFSSLSERDTVEYPINAISIIPCKTIANIHVLEPLLITENKPILNSEFMCDDYCTGLKSGIDINELKKYYLLSRSDYES